jgi:hypothetical protein
VPKANHEVIHVDVEKYNRQLLGRCGVIKGSVLRSSYFFFFSEVSSANQIENTDNNL